METSSRGTDAPGLRWMTHAPSMYQTAPPLPRPGDPMTRPRRKLTLLDAMILVAAVAAGLAAQRAYYLGPWYSSAISPLRQSLDWYLERFVSRRRLQELSAVWEDLSPKKRAEHDRSQAALERQIAAYKRRIALVKGCASVNVLLCLPTLALVGIGLRKPRPRLRRLAQDPGWAGCLTAVVALAVRMISVLVAWCTDLGPIWPAPDFGPAYVAVFDDMEGYAGPAVVAAWVLMAIGRRFRPDWSSLGWLTMIAAASWVLLLFKGVAIVILAPL